MKVKVYSITQCPWCDKAKKYLKSKNVDFEELNIENSEEDAKACLALSGDTMVPVITADNKEYVVGFDKEKIDSILGIK